VHCAKSAESFQAAKEDHTHTRSGVCYIKRDYIFFTLRINVGII
jgi:hypothetical protein